MSKKEFSNIGARQENLKGGLSHLINPDEKKPKKQEADHKEDTVKSFNIFTDDIEYLNRYVRYMGYKNNEKYTQKKALNDAIGLLKAKYPEI